MFQLSPRLTLYCVIPILIVFSIVRIGMRFLVNNMRTRQTDLPESLWLYSSILEWN